MEALDERQWNALVRGGYPFLQHQFLSALERCQCVGAACGWLPRHLGCFDNGALVGAMPLYEKHNSWGEFVFDHAWAAAFHRAGLNYYPKLVNAIPFTPAGGQRILARPTARREITAQLLHGAHELMRQGPFSGLHSLFIEADEFELLRTRTAVSRVDCQFHWHNRGYRDFAEFLSTLKAKKRNNIRRERAAVQQSGVLIERLDGHTAKAQDWHAFAAMYRRLYDRKHGAPAFTAQFFMAVAAAMPTQIQLVMARRHGSPCAAALMYLDEHTLYGRHWGCHGYLNSLHFELCYYQGIEICIERGLQRFDPGAQGEHKIARGFTPTQTRSLHWLQDNPFTNAIQQFVGNEKSHVKQYIHAVQQHSPYHQSDASSGETPYNPPP